MSNLTGTKDRPPIIKVNFGSDAWPGIAGANPPTVVIVDIAGDIQAVDTGSMIQIAGTPMWYYVIADRITAGLPEAGASWTYYVTAGAGGNLVADGNIELDSNLISLTQYTISDHTVICPTALMIPGSVSNPRVQPIQFIARAPSGDILTLDSVSITIGTEVVAAAMSSTAGTWQYDWTIAYDATPQIYEMKIEATLNGKTIPFPHVVETYKPKEFTTQRLSSGLVI